MWNRTGLPAVFPLQFKTPLDGSDYLTVIDSVTGEPILGHLCMAGRFSGRWCPAEPNYLRFATGDDWRGEHVLLGTATQFIDHPETLNFEMR